MLQLAERLGMTVADLGRRMTSAELTEWQALDELRHEERVRADLARKAAAKVRRRCGENSC